ncbi:MAG: extracellular solute-binding protein [Clostridia bacterium]|nr:extracellular solute-binding protein [Clostridia bacterium]
MKKRLLALALVLALVCAGCAGAAAPEYSCAPAREGRLVVYTSHKEQVYGPIIKEFQERTGIWVELRTGGTNDLLERISAEADAPQCDVMFGGGMESLEAYRDYFEPYAYPDAYMLKDSCRAEGDWWTPFSALPVVLIYNTKLVSPKEFTGWANLLEERWKGKIAFADPTVSGSSYTALLTLVSCLPGDTWELIARFEKNLDGNILPDSGQVVSSVAEGKNFVGVTLEETALKAAAQGADIAIVYPGEGTSAVPDGSALIHSAPHADNAKRFLDFVQSKDVQRLVVSDFRRRSVREDIASPTALTPEKLLGIIDYDVTWASGMKSEFLERWARLVREDGT